MIYCVEDDDNIRELVIYTRKYNRTQSKGLRRRNGIYGKLWRLIRQSLFCLISCFRERMGWNFYEN